MHNISNRALNCRYRNPHNVNNIDPVAADRERRLRRSEATRRYREKRRRLASNQLDELEDTAVQPAQLRVTESTKADAEFLKRFTENKFGVSCSVCHRVWFQNDVRKPPVNRADLLKNSFPSEQVENFIVCQTCYKSLCQNKIPRLSRSNGFRFPEYPRYLPNLNMITERLISPRIPFMQIRRLRVVYGSKAIIGQVINVPIDINKMVCELPRQLTDDHSFNVHLKRHIIHKSTYLQGFVNKAEIKIWLSFLLQSTLYRQYNIFVNEHFFANENTPPVADGNEDIIEIISPNEETDNNFLLAMQQSLMWLEDKYLTIAPGMGQVPMNQIYDEHSEELSFPSIYLGEPRIFTIDNVTPFMMAPSEIRRQDRRAVKPEHILYMAMKIMRLRLNQALKITFKNISDISNITRSDIENLEFVKNCMEQNMSFLKSIPNSAHYWFQRKRDVFSMIRQLGKPTLFLTLSASEYRWDNLLRTLYKLAEGTEFCGTNAVVQLSADKRTTLVNEDPVTCCLYFNKLVDTIIWILSSSKCSPFGNYKIIDWFKRIEFQQRGSPHAHLLLWLENDPNEETGENMPQTLKMIDFLCSVNPQKLQNVPIQTHKHTFTCYKRGNDAETGRCRFEAPFWPMEKTSILIPMPKEDGRRSTLKSKYADMHRSLEFEEFPSLEAFLAHHNINSYENYLNVLRAGITRPRIFLKRKIEERFINSFHPWISQVLNSNMDIQFILEPYSCATYVLEYVNKTDRGITNLHRDLIKLRDEFPDKDYSDLLKSLGIKVLNAVEMSCQEAAWYLLNLHMSEKSEKFKKDMQEKVLNDDIDMDNKMRDIDINQLTNKNYN